MTPSPQFQKLVQILFARRRPPGPIGFAPLRAGFTAAALPAAADVERHALAIAGLTVEQLTTPGADPTRLVLYLHGGGYVMGSPDTHRKLAGDVARATGVRVLLPDYPLAPEQPFPAAIAAIAALYEALLAAGARPERIAIAGDSAGGGLTAAVMLVLRARGVALPAAGVLISPWLDMVRDDDVDPLLAARDPIIAPEDLAMFRGWYLNGADPRDPLASPVRADLHGLPPMLVHVGGAEILVGDARRFAAQCTRAGVPVELEVWDEMIHVWHVFAGRVPESTAAVERIGSFVRARLGVRPLGRERQ
jgi:acetyl esterase/lipase